LSVCLAAPSTKVMLGSIYISGREWLLPAGGFLSIALVLLAWTYLRAPAARNLRTSCAFLKLLGVAALLVCLLEPFWSGQRARPGANFFAIVADNSQGMNVKDRNEKLTRAEHVTNILAAASGDWQETLANNFQVRRYYFDTRLQSTRDFSELTFDGRASSIATALRTIGDRFRGQPLAGVLLLTDGNATDLPDGKIEASDLPPIYPVVIGRDETINDIAIQKIAVSQTSFEDAPVSVQADVAAGGYGGRMIVAQVLDHTGKTVQEQSRRTQSGGETFRFQLRPEKSGISFYRLRVSARDELGQFASEAASTEATLANNSRVLVVDRGKGPYRILYVSGRPNWEFKFLNRALAEDDQVELVGLIRIARRERGFGKFEFRSRPGESANPLFRGFDRTTEETEGYDEPVLKWLVPSHGDTNWITAGFPKVPQDLFRYHAVILDDLEAEFFTRDQLSLLQKFISERGGGFLMLGGAESFHQGKYAHTPIGEMLPVYIDFLRETTPVANLRLSLSKEGWLQPWARLRDNEAAERKRLDEMPALQVLNRVRDVKPGASVIAEVQDATGKKYPALVAQRFGNGRVGAMLVGDLWRWGLHDETTRKDMDKSWRQTIRWLIADVPERIAFHAEPKRDDPNQAMSLQVRVRDKEFKPLDNASVRITVTPLADSLQADPAMALQSTNSIQLTAEAALTEAGRYDAMYVPRLSGGYFAEAVVTDAEGVEVGRVETGWSADPAAEEFRSLKPNRALLENVARQTGGEVIAATDLPAFAARLPNRKAPISENWSFPLWHQPLVFLFALACFAAEWGLRRWKGMA
jgi:uncharacterized membrane protein